MNDISPLYARNYTCPVCQLGFTSLNLRSSRIYLEKKESDFHCYYRGYSPLHYNIIICPTCKYAAPSSKFSAELSTHIVEQLSLALSRLSSPDLDFRGERDLEMAMQSFQLAVRTAQLKKEPAGELASLILACAWIAREMDNQDLEKTYLQEALNYYLKSYQGGSTRIGKLDDLKAAYLIGELHLRLGMYPEAVKWFGIVISNSSIKTNPALEKLTRDQWALARELSKENPPQQSAAALDEQQTPAKKNKPAPRQPAQAADTAKRMLMQTNLHLYDDQIKWLNQIVNQAYTAKKSLITKEQVLRALLDVLAELIHDDLPDTFKNEAELKETVLNYLKINKPEISPAQNDKSE